MKLFQDVKKIHFIGIGGIGVSAITKLVLKQGKFISGSDVAMSEIIKELEKMGAEISIGHRKKNLNPKTDLVIYTPAVKNNNPERQKAKELKIPELSYPQILGELSKNKQTIAVSGTNGKTTSTALLGLILEAANFDPTVIVGSRVKTFAEGNLRIGKSNHFVVEACEWQANMLNLNPKTIVLTNIEEDHLDYYRDLDHIIETFQKYVDRLSSDGLLILNADDPISQKLKKPNCRIITYGIKSKADLIAKNIRIKNECQIMDFVWQNKSFSISLQKIPGRFNIYNALGASACALALGTNPKMIQKALANFQGVWRRFERIALWPTMFIPNNTKDPIPPIKKYQPIIISDYAHHPTAVQETIQGAREFYPDRRIVAVFQPHHYNRTKKLFNDFVKSFDQADLIILNEIFDVTGRESKEDYDISSKDLCKAIKKRCPEKKIFYGKNLIKTKNLISKNLFSNDLILLMGAGDIYKISSKC